MYNINRSKAKRVSTRQLLPRKLLKSLDFFFVHGETSICCCMFIFDRAHGDNPKKILPVVYKSGNSIENAPEDATAWYLHYITPTS